MAATEVIEELEKQVCDFCGKPGDEEKPLKVWVSQDNDTQWFYHDPCLWDEMERDELEEQETCRGFILAGAENQTRGRS